MYFSTIDKSSPQKLMIISLKYILCARMLTRGDRIHVSYSNDDNLKQLRRKSLLVFHVFPPTQASVIFFSYMDNLLLLTHDIIVERAYSEFFDWNVIFPLTLQSTFVTIRFIFRSTSIALSEKKTKRYHISNWFCNGSVVSWFMCFAIIYLIRL